jgi:hypothetical protein
MQMKQVSLQLSCQIREKERRTRREGNLFSCNGVELNTEGNLFSGGEARDRRSKRKRGGEEDSVEKGGSERWGWGLGGAVGWGGGGGG